MDNSTRARDGKRRVTTYREALNRNYKLRKSNFAPPRGSNVGLPPDFSQYTTFTRKIQDRKLVKDRPKKRCGEEVNVKSFLLPEDLQVLHPRANIFQILLPHHTCNL